MFKRIHAREYVNAVCQCFSTSFCFSLSPPESIFCLYRQCFPITPPSPWNFKNHRYTIYLFLHYMYICALYIKIVRFFLPPSCVYSLGDDIAPIENPHSMWAYCANDEIKRNCVCSKELAGVGTDAPFEWKTSELKSFVWGFFGGGNSQCSFSRN